MTLSKKLKLIGQVFEGLAYGYIIMTAVKLMLLILTNSVILYSVLFIGPESLVNSQNDELLPYVLYWHQYLVHAILISVFGLFFKWITKREVK